ncbi:MAG: class I SAM-dependent methyltransferase [Candidatus Competibacterales bacterium]
MKHDDAGTVNLKTSTDHRDRWGGWERRLLERTLAAAGNPPVEMVLWNGQRVHPPFQTEGLFRIHLKDRLALYQLCFHPELYLGELYSSERLIIDGDLTEFIKALFYHLPPFHQRTWWLKLMTYLSVPGRNTLRRARRNIHHHYDIGNAFYQLWLDKDLVYTCAYYKDPGLDLEVAQRAKLDHVCRKLRLAPGETVVEAGCGWGALAIHMAKYYGVKVRAYNISQEQLAFARNRASAEGLTERVTFVEGDYREIDGTCDAFVSVGMLEHVGRAQFDDLGQVIHRCLPANGRGLIHSIGRNYPGPMNAWTEKHIFPGSYPPTLAEMAKVFAPGHFAILDVENLRLHYARTLEHWLERFEAHKDQVQDMFDEAFVRTWRFYLAASTASFAAGDLQLYQVVFNRKRNNDIPWSRAHLYT